MRAGRRPETMIAPQTFIGGTSDEQFSSSYCYIQLSDGCLSSSHFSVDACSINFSCALVRQSCRDDHSPSRRGFQ
ncbi:Protein of unknown function [Pyronema omphalodes CBS 100304]|uniref:Uncharacterized protein n=1 Tax=Pyronema omphalodes (strain CBS 100304) TaxID=1076935 RepID=U4L9I2_PYROM|nr:Protein of unknown function [Pyronema omphalodes CBS 100304]